jgi:drug/metabolite transporter (DMT)-like permease
VLASLLALLASLSWGSSDFVAGIVSRRTSAWATALIGQIVAALGSLALLAVLAPAAPTAGIVVVLILGGLASSVGVFAAYRALTLTKMSVVAPIYAGAAVVPVLWGLASGEKPSALQLAGVVATLVGIAWISRPDRQAPEERLPVNLAGVLLALAAAVGLGLMLVALDYGADANSYWAVAVVRCSATVWIGLSLAVTRPRLRLRRGALLPLLVVGLLILAANALFAGASAMADLSVVGVLGWLGPAVTVMWAHIVLRERLRPTQWLAAALVLAGVVCLALG